MMNRTGRKLIWIGVILILLLIPTAIAAAKELSMMTISGPGIGGGGITLDDPDELLDLQEKGFMDQGMPITPANAVELRASGEGYVITRYLSFEEGPVAWDQVEYYPGAEGQPGFFYLVGPLEGNMEPNWASDEWYRAGPRAEQGLRDLLTAHGVTVITPSITPIESAAEVPAAVEAPAISEAAGEPAVAPPQKPEMVNEQAPAAPSAPAQPREFPMGWLISIAAALVVALGAARWIAAQRRTPQMESAPAQK